MHQGNWKCSSCGGTITELPFEPRSEAGLTCRACFIKQKEKEKQEAPVMPGASENPDMPPEDAGLAGEPDLDDGLGAATTPVSSDKPRFEGDWKCASCGAAITSLPFEPRATGNLKCIDCFKESKR